MIQAEAFGGVSKVYHTTAGRGFTRYFGEGNKFFGGGGYGEGGMCAGVPGESVRGASKMGVRARLRGNSRREVRRSRKREMRARLRGKAEWRGHERKIRD
ncbi:hypothetical protein AB1K84_19070 [Mesobacillus foraminis]|uniref:hypothetical protein n=1 Tax=Mesobacillus foraminis TaxID=279826 RepID=UPI0039A10A34